MASSELRLQVDLPTEHETGVPADFASVWHTSASFVLDFVAAKSPAKAAVDKTTGAETGGRVMPARVVSRVRIPPQQVFELARALTQQLDAWERETGHKADGSGPKD
ncbi:MULTISPECIES: DUF3467 domain-containing protein [Isoptericola]|uniref:DUF3467 domain-containing protein n=1 Tax=Isoptericola sediminis TaxID=2733572 RepID=A0A849K409_9MICO|nr:MULTISPECIES: DUF3467 domain-containing protein [Isoptericola]MDO8144457.1 DUF3467 domain-containing protein [Isoptericola sp. 178]MDO8148311.1 DUF3467 domain-containing protein [Isoptericola sp. b515]MDO8151792.1 DUF3467 domain-containing protein [Isoptericola sp. b408]NNU28058.1 DUF3467 domain-containing protein [Isoptericola sediminis]